MRGLLLLPLLVLTAGCWQPRYFAPRESLNGTGPHGEQASVYQLTLVDAAGAGTTGGAPTSVSKGRVRVWSEGARARFTDDDEVVDLHVGFELVNNGIAPLELDAAAVVCEDLYVDGLLQPPLSPVDVHGSGYALPGTTTQLDLIFRPATTVPRDVERFQVRFTVVDDAGRSASEVTPFGPTSRSAGARWGGGYWGSPGGYWGGYWGGYYGGGYWGPGLGGWWGPGIGFYGRYGCW